MGRQPVAAQRLPSQRESVESRSAAAENTALQQQLDACERARRAAVSDASYWHTQCMEKDKLILKLTPPSLDGCKTAIPKLKDQSTAFYDHVDFGFRWLRRFDTTDVPLLTSAVLHKLALERREEEGADFTWFTLMSKGFKAARERLLHERDLSIHKHLSENVYTADHFSILRLVGKLSLRVCSLIEQSIKWIHRADGTKERQCLCPGSTVPAPTLFGLAAIHAAESKAMEETKLSLRDHDDRKGADIGGQAYALDRAMFDSVGQTSRAGGMATKGTKDDPHLMCVTGDGAGLTARDSGVRVASFPGSTNLLAQVRHLMPSPFPPADISALRTTLQCRR